MSDSRKEYTEELIYSSSIIENLRLSIYSPKEYSEEYSTFNLVSSGVSPTLH